ncbi:hypothetical protein F0562_023963 [Nyssa sinensis]|uniref:Uncharacterized protein n=1 Tax=Nyssa sinensis TaxID=561372 RepID=A0A5J5BNS5_9ASTE|nr:hypothetical protein F0562_023963 [Nyssa sinensis]
MLMIERFPFAISFVPRPRNPPLYKSAITRTCHPIIQVREFWLDWYARLDQIDGTLAFRQFSELRWLPLLSITNPIDEPLVHKFCANLEAISDQVTTKAFVRGIAFDLTLALIVETLSIPREDEPSFPYAWGTTPKNELLMFLRLRVDGIVADEDYLVNQTPPQYRRDPSPPHPFHPDRGASSSNAHPPVTRGDLKEYFQRLWMALVIPVLQELST